MILESIFRGEFSPVEQTCPTNPEYHILTKEIADLLDILSSNIAPESRAILESLLEKIQGAQLVECEAFYYAGASDSFMLFSELSNFSSNKHFHTT